MIDFLPVEGDGPVEAELVRGLNLLSTAPEHAAQILDLGLVANLETTRSFAVFEFQNVSDLTSGHAAAYSVARFYSADGARFRLAQVRKLDEGWQLFRISSGYGIDLAARALTEIEAHPETPQPALVSFSTTRSEGLAAWRVVAGNTELLWPILPQQYRLQGGRYYTPAALRDHFSGPG